jgi:hypothetical protein
MGLTRLRALHPGRPWEVALESEASGKREASAAKECPSPADAGKRGRCRGGTPRTPSAAGARARRAQSSRLTYMDAERSQPGWSWLAHYTSL